MTDNDMTYYHERNVSLSVMTYISVEKRPLSITPPFLYKKSIVVNLFFSFHTANEVDSQKYYRLVSVSISNPVLRDSTQLVGLTFEKSL